MEMPMKVLMVSAILYAQVAQACNRWSTPVTN